MSTNVENGLKKITTYHDLLDELYYTHVKYSFWKSKYEKKEIDLWLKTNWEEVFPDKKPTVKDKELWIKEQLLESKELRDTCRMQYEHLKKIYEICLKYGIEVLSSE